MTWVGVDDLLELLLAVLELVGHLRLLHPRVDPGGDPVKEHVHLDTLGWNTGGDIIYCNFLFSGSIQVLISTMYFN